MSGFGGNIGSNYVSPWDAQRISTFGGMVGSNYVLPWDAQRIGFGK